MKAAMRILTLVAAGTVTATILALDMSAIDAPEQQDPADHPAYAMNISLPEGAFGVIQPSPGHRANARLTALTALGLIALMWTRPNPAAIARNTLRAAAQCLKEIERAAREVSPI